MNIIVTEETENGDVPIDIYSKLANDRILFIHNYIDDRTAIDTVATLMLKDSEDSNQKISIFINAGGGDLRSVFMIYDAMKLIQSPIETFCIGEAIDEAALILAGGTPGMRFATTNSLVCVGQLYSNGSMRSDIAEAFVLMDRIKRDNKMFMTELAKCTGKKIKDLIKDLDRRKFFNAKQAKTYGLIDAVVVGK